MKYDAEAFPQSVCIEATALCNARCTFCPMGKLAARPGLFPYDNFVTLIDECKAAGGIHTLSLSLYGEPLIHPELVGMVAYAHMQLPRAKIGFFTNASLLVPNVAGDLLEAGLSWLTFSVDSLDEAEYASMRVGLALPIVRRNIDIFTQMNNALGHPVHTRVHMTLTSKNEHQREAFMAHWKSGYGIDEVSSLPCDGRGGEDRDPAAGEYAITDPCYSPFGTANILTDGTMIVCCQDHSATLPMGNAFAGGVGRWWNSQALTAFRVAHNAGRKNSYALCRACKTHF